MKIDKIALRPREAAEILSVSLRKLGQMTKDEGFPSVKAGKVRLYLVADLTAWLEKEKYRQGSIEGRK